MKKRILVIGAVLLALLLLASDVAPAYAAAPPEGTQMLRCYAPTEPDFCYLSDDISVSVNPGANTITVQAWFYIDSISSSGSGNPFTVFMMWDNVLLFGPYYMYAVTVAYPVSGQAGIYVNRYVSWGGPDPEFIEWASVDTWYNVTQIHTGTTIDVYVNDVLEKSLTGVSNAVYAADYIQIGEYETGTRTTYLAYDMYVDFIDLAQTGGANYTEDFETDLSAWTEVKSSGATIEIATATQGGGTPEPPSGIFSITPPSINGTYNSVVTFYANCYNNDSTYDYQYGLEIRSISGESWTWLIQDPYFWLEAQELRQIPIYCTIGSSGEYSSATVRFYQVANASNYYEDSALAISTGWGDAYTGDPGGEGSVVITDYANNFLGLTLMLGLGAIGKGIDPKGWTATLFLMIVGLMFAYLTGLLPAWILAGGLGVLALLFAVTIAGSLGGNG